MLLLCIFPKGVEAHISQDKYEDRISFFLVIAKESNCEIG
jgi:hypothetical protein